MVDMMKMLGKMKEVQTRMKEAQDRLAQLTTEADAGGGMVKATMNGKRQLVSLSIDPVLMKPEDRDMLQDLIIAAVNKATDEAESMAREELKKSTEGILPNIPGIDLSSMMG